MRALAPVFLIACFAMTAPSPAALGQDRPEPTITNLVTTLDGSTLSVDFELDNALGEDLLERVDSGLPVSLVYQFQIVRDRRWWFDQRLRARLEVVARYSVVTMEYRISYRLEDKLVDSRLVQDHAELEEAMTRFADLSILELPRGIEPDLTLRVRANLGTEAFLWVIPTRVTTPWAESLLILPPDFADPG